MSRWLAAVSVLGALIWTLFASLPAAAHEVRPAYLEISQTGANDYTVLWKQPTMGEMAVHLVPHLSNGWLERPADSQDAESGFLIRRWNVHAAQPLPLDGRDITIEGLADTITDVFVRVRLSDGRALDGIVRPDTPRFRIEPQARAPSAAFAFLKLGVLHILSGPDHLAFVLGLLLIVRNRWMLLKTVSAFTVAHSITLTAATLGYVNLPSALLDALIALSILFVAPEAWRAQRGGTSLTIRHPWIVAFCFGLLHGLGFASGLTTLGLDRLGLAKALFSFNVGVEIGQLTFIGAVFALWALVRPLARRWPQPLALAPTYAIGGLGAFLALQNAALVFGLGPSIQ